MHGKCIKKKCCFQVDGREFEVEVVDSVIDYLQLMKSIFDFNIIRNLIKGSNTRAPFNILIDSMNGGKINNFNYIIY